MTGEAAFEVEDDFVLPGTDISVVGPGAYGAESEPGPGSRDCVYMERMSTDMTALKMQYDKLRKRQRQAHIIIAGQLVVLSLLGS